MGREQWALRQCTLGSGAPCALEGSSVARGGCSVAGEQAKAAHGTPRQRSAHKLSAPLQSPCFICHVALLSLILHLRCSTLNALLYLH